MGRPASVIITYSEEHPEVFHEVGTEFEVVTPVEERPKKRGPKKASVLPREPEQKDEQ